MGRGGILLTGATGFLGRYLLRDLLAAGHRVAVLVRPAGATTAEDRVRELTEFARETAGRRLPVPAVIPGDLCEPGFGLTAADLRLARNQGSVVHAAASLSFRRTADGEPHRTNAAATRRLFEWCTESGVRTVHHVSTAFVCGDRTGPILETDADDGQQFHNDYERSKRAAELAARKFSELRVTVYRPSVIVGDSRTGDTSA
ncbi:MAG: SDR family oxidoreductase [Planctomycetes bacterium]|nr:SDR family oxidoreductase [Planctomycetota bacterium]